MAHEARGHPIINLTAPEATLISAIIAACAVMLTICTTIIVAAYNKNKERTLEYAKKLWDARLDLYQELMGAASKMHGLHGGWTIPQRPEIIPGFIDVGVNFSEFDKRVGIIASDDVALAWRATSNQFLTLMAFVRSLNDKYKDHQGDVPEEFKKVARYARQFKIGHDLMIRLMRAELEGRRASRADRKLLTKAKNSFAEHRLHPWTRDE